MFLRSIARPLLASWFIYGSVESVLEPELRAARSKPAIQPLLDEAKIDVDVTDLVKWHGMASIAAASVLAMSKTPKTAGLVLAGLATATAATGRPFWLLDEGEARDYEKAEFFKNLSLLGGTLLAATAGHSAHHKKKAAKRKAKAKAHKAEAKGRKTKSKLRRK